MQRWVGARHFEEEGGGWCINSHDRMPEWALTCSLCISRVLTSSAQTQRASTYLTELSARRETMDGFTNLSSPSRQHRDVCNLFWQILTGDKLMFKDALSHEDRFQNHQKSCSWDKRLKFTTLHLPWHLRRRYRQCRQCSRTGAHMVIRAQVLKSASTCPRLTWRNSDKYALHYILYITNMKFDT